MARTIGSQTRETLKEAGYCVAELPELRAYSEEAGGVALVSPDGSYELWVLNDHHAGYTIEVDGYGYEFAHTIVIH